MYNHTDLTVTSDSKRQSTNEVLKLSLSLCLAQCCFRKYRVLPGKTSYPNTDKENDRSFIRGTRRYFFLVINVVLLHLNTRNTRFSAIVPRFLVLPWRRPHYIFTLNVIQLRSSGLSHTITSLSNSCLHVDCSAVI